jgi:hypothetical protein
MNKDFARWVTLYSKERENPGSLDPMVRTNFIENATSGIALRNQCGSVPLMNIIRK